MHSLKGDSHVALVLKNPPANARDLIRDMDSISGLGGPPGGGNGNPLQYSCLEDPMDGGARRATVQGVAMTWTSLRRLSMHAHAHEGGLHETLTSCEALCQALAPG